MAILRKPAIPRKLREKWPMIVGIILGLTAAFLVVQYVNQKIATQQQETKKQIGELRPVLIATQDIPEGEVIKSGMVKVVGYPERYIQPKVCTSPGEAIGKLTLGKIVQGEQILKTKLTYTKKVRSLALKTPPGKRAMTIPIDIISGVGGFIRPGDKVDILGTFSVPVMVGGKQVPQSVTITLFQNIQVLAVGRELVEQQREAGLGVLKKESKKKITNITLALTPEEVEFLIVASEHGKIRLSLRSGQDDEIRMLPMGTFQDMMSLYAPKAPETQQQPPTVEVYRGLEKEIVPLPSK